MLALLLALSSECAGLVPAALPQPVEVDACSFVSIDGTGDVAANDSTYARRLFFDPSGALLASSTASVGLPQVRGWLALDYGGYSQPPAPWAVRISSVDRDGGLLGQWFSYDLGTYAMQADPRGGALLFRMLNGRGSWSIDFWRLSTSATVVDGPRTLAVGKGGFPNQWAFAPRVAADGTILITTQGSPFPPLRNNQLAARWFDPFGGPVTPWFVAVDQTLEGGVMLALPDGGMALWSDAGQVAIHPGSTKVDPTPGWIPSDRFQYGGYTDAIVLRDRIAVRRRSDSPCEQQLDILAPAGNVCGTVHFPLAVSSDRFCNSRYGPFVGDDGTVVQDGYKPGYACGIRWWPHLLGR
jgi:hypothetical protein